MKSTQVSGLLVCLLSVGVAHAQLATQSVTFAVGQAIPDNDANGLASTKTFTSDIVSLSNVAVRLDISGTWNGDLYGYVVHDTGFAILLNRPGRATGVAYGYNDPGFDITLNDQAGVAVGDIHTYRLTLGDPNPLNAALTGIWNSDGRYVDPAFVLDTDARTSTLANFVGLNPNGDWTLFLADLSASDQSTLVAWGLEAYGVVPEPGAAFLFLVGLPALWWTIRRRQS